MECPADFLGGAQVLLISERRTHNLRLLQGATVVKKLKVGGLARVAVLIAGLAIPMTFSSAAAQKVVGDWLVQIEADRFGDGGTDVAMTASATTAVAFAVRCIRREWSLAVLDLSSDPKPLKSGSAFAFKFRVDQNVVVKGYGAAVNERLIQLETETNLVSQILKGKELAMRLERPDGATIDMVFPISSAPRALASHLKDCPPPK